ncbi:DEAD-box ATP-dependent RNA helicase 57-like [Canna indica]|uniref:RNA helicase n=1 Tax=Canna indica TaxID=4628 RepID=A0AAQ3L0C4_9LILI|nr:DEAD-box ATP-dependent RNA helicase 57-like [Canna indica]
MDRASSLLFSGVHVNRKRFSQDIARFQQAKEKVNSSNAEDEASLPSLEAKVNKKEKKRKRKDKDSSVVEGFSVFKSSESLPSIREKNALEADSAMQKKEEEKQIERASIMRKKYGIHISGHGVPPPLESFAELSSRYNCKPYILRNLSGLGFREPTPIQRQAIPVLLSKRDCFACAPTGSGKTLAFLCPMLMKIKPGSKKGVKGVILCPTRELASQTARECKKLAKGRKFYIKLMTKELSRCGDFEKMTCDIIISTPLRLDYVIRKRKLDLSRVKYLVLDEADKLFELGFLEQIDSVVKACSKTSIVRSLFSATLPETVEKLASTVMVDAVRIIIGRKNSASELIKQKLIFAGSEKGKLLALRQRFSESLNPPVLVFVQSKERAKELYKELAFDDIKADAIHADLSQQQRDDAVDNFRSGKTWVLIATDVVARGMDFKGVNCVINYDFPESAAAYIHRIGRSGRAGRPGEAVTLYTEEDKPFLRNIANVMAASGCEVPAWILALPKLRKRKHRPGRDSISVIPEDAV